MAVRGRLVKKSDQEKIGNMNVEEYPWKEFSTETILLPDNPRRSVVLAKSHPQQELSRKVHQPPEFGKVFGAPSKPLLPEDMTAEFLASQEELRQRKRRMQMDEDEAVALELLDLDEEEQKNMDGTNPAEGESAGAANADAAASVSKSAVRGVGPDISDLSKLAAQKNLGLDDGDLNFSGPHISQEAIDKKIQEAFQNGLNEGRAEGEKLGFSAAMTQMSPRAESGAEAQSQATPEKSFQDGLQEGIALGKEEATRDAEEKYQHSLALFTKALSELQHLKGELLVTGREIFAEIAQICAEKVLRTSVRLNDNALRNVFDAATGQFQAQDELRIEMHPEDIARIETQISDEQKKRIRLVANNKLERGDLKIEANNEVVSLDLHNTVQQVIDTLKDDLFEVDSKDDITGKAG